MKYVIQVFWALLTLITMSVAANMAWDSISPAWVWFYFLSIIFGFTAYLLHREKP